MKDSFDRKIDYMRVSITENCNLRCGYCMPNGLPPSLCKDILSYDEIVMVCREAVKLGIVKFKITGGEPLVRKNCASLIKKIYQIDGVEQVTLTTNGVLLKEQVQDLIEAGIKSINISLDTLSREKYHNITGFDAFDKVFDSIMSTLEAGIKVKINAVMHDKEYRDDFINLVGLAKDYPIDVRFIEMMPIGCGVKSRLVSNDVLLETLQGIYRNIEIDDVKRGNGPAVYYKIPQFKGAIGFISAMNGKFCKNCNRIRLTSHGEIKSCLCFDNGMSLLDAIKKGDTLEILKLIQDSILDKPEEHCFDKFVNITERRKMVQIGG